MKLFLILFLTASIVRAESLNVSILGLTLHSAPADSDGIAQRMTRKIDSQGYLAQHVEFNMTYTTDSDWFYNLTTLKDCFDLDTFFAGIGKQWKLNDGLYANFSFGVFARPIPKDRYYVAGINSGDMNYLPTPWVGLKKVFSLSDTWGLTLQGNSNIFLTHATVGIEYNLP